MNKNMSDPELDLRKCPSCGVESPFSEYDPKEMFACEICGEHIGVECPNCGDWIDLILEGDGFIHSLEVDMP